MGSACRRPWFGQCSRPSARSAPPASPAIPPAVLCRAAATPSRDPRASPGRSCRGQRNEPKLPAQHDISWMIIDRPLPRPLTVGFPPNRTSNASTAPNGLHRRPHVFVARHQRPARRFDPALHLAAVIHRQRRGPGAVGDHLGPDVAVTLTTECASPSSAASPDRAWRGCPERRRRRTRAFCRFHALTALPVWIR